MRRLIALLFVAVAAAGCVNGRDAIRQVEVWKDPDRPVVCYVVTGVGTTVSLSCVVVGE